MSKLIDLLTVFKLDIITTIVENEKIIYNGTIGKLPIEIWRGAYVQRMDYRGGAQGAVFFIEYH